MKSFIKKHKFLFILFLFILFLFINTKSNAVSDSFTASNGTLYNYTINDNITKYIILEYSDGSIYLLNLSSYSEEEIIFEITGSAKYFTYFFSNSGRYTCDIYTFNKSTSSFTKTDTAYKLSNSLKINVLHSDVSIYLRKDTYGSNGTGYIYELTNFNIFLSTTENTNSPLKVYSNDFTLEEIEKYECYVSNDSINWYKMNDSTYTNSETNITCFRYFYYILKNDTYYFKFIDIETNKEVYSISKTITNIINTENNNGITIDGIPQPHITYERKDSYFILKTQSLLDDEFLKYNCFFTTDINSSFDTWSPCSVSTHTNTTTNETEIYYYTTIPIDSENTTFCFVFYDYNSKKYGNVTTFTCDITYMNDYCDKVQESLENSNSKFNELINFFKERFGFLTYPFEFISDLLNRILNIEYKEPIIHIPELKIPNTENIIFNGIDYNFNTLLENNSISNIYNIYLIAVDFIIIIGLIIFAKNVLMGVFGNG